MSSLGEVKAAARDMINRDDMDDDQILRFVNLGLTRVLRYVRLPSMEALVALPVGEDGTATVPSDLIELISVYHEDNPDVELEWLSLPRILRFQQQGVGAVGYYSRVGQKFIMGPVPPVSSNLFVHYYKDVPLLVSDDDIDPILVIAQDVIVLAAAIEAALVFVDDRLSVFQEQMTARIEELQSYADRVKSAEGPKSVFPLSDLDF